MILLHVAVGEKGLADDEISATDVGNTVTYGHIAPDQNVWRSGRLYTDNHIAAFVDSWSLGSFNSPVRAELQGGHLQGYLAVVTRCLCVANNNTTNFLFPVPIKIPKQSTVNVRGIAKGPNSEVTTAIMLHVRLE